MFLVFPLVGGHAEARSALDLVRSEVQKLTGAKKRQVSTGLIEGNANDSLQRFKRGRKAFGSRIESRFVAASVQGISALPPWTMPGTCRLAQHVVV